MVSCDVCLILTTSITIADVGLPLQLPSQKDRLLFGRRKGSRRKGIIFLLFSISTDLISDIQRCQWRCSLIILCDFMFSSSLQLLLEKFHRHEKFALKKVAEERKEREEAETRRKARLAKKEEEERQRIADLDNEPKIKEITDEEAEKLENELKQVHCIIKDFHLNYSITVQVVANLLNSRYRRTGRYVDLLDLCKRQTSSLNIYYLYSYPCYL